MSVKTEAFRSFCFWLKNTEPDTKTAEKATTNPAEKIDKTGIMW